MTNETTVNTIVVPTPTAKTPSKSAAVIKLLTRARGATVAEMELATGWQPHSVRAYLSRLRKAGRTLDKEERKSGETSYRFAPTDAATAVKTKLGLAPDSCISGTAIEREAVA
jgi:hypothetical protein